MIKRWIWILALTISGCAYDYAPGGAPSYEASWAGMEHFIEERCSNCHGFAPGAGGVQLPQDIELDLASGSGELVITGNPDDSLLLQVIENGAMPAGNRPMPAEMSAHVRAWILNGAVLP